ncbi:Type IV fimbrial biogenesis protein, prepilin cysteine protease [gamma proteobacterium HdN1]|nr:Type IV fimbrial biogenesis protein, prepilin cysteine protease [gamma proteobacterium HdN1]
MSMIQTLNAYPALLVGIVFVFGLLLGSFFNVVIYRLPLMLHLEWWQSARDFCEEAWGKVPAPLDQPPESLPAPPFNLAKPNSRCPHCGHAIQWYENIPIASWLWLRGKCRACRVPISARYPLIELATGLLSAFVAWKMGFGWPLAFALILTWSLICLTMIDFDYKLLPDQITLPLLWLGLLINVQGMFVPLDEAVIGAAAGYLSLWSIYWLFKLATGKEGMGYGDFKLLGALGAWMGWKVLVVIILLSSLVGSIIGVSMILILGRDKQIPIAFGPYLAIAGWIAFFWGEALMGMLFRF